MAKKAALFGDTATELRIRVITDPAVRKALGRTVASFDQECWERHLYNIVFTANMHKFLQNPELRPALVATGQLHLAEASPVSYTHLTLPTICSV